MDIKLIVAFLALAIMDFAACYQRHRAASFKLDKIHALSSYHMDNRVSDTNMHFCLFFDGGSRSVRSDSSVYGAGGYNLFLSNNRTHPYAGDTLIHIINGSIWYGQDVSSHEAEYLSLCDGLRAMHSLHKRSEPSMATPLPNYLSMNDYTLNIFSDSEIVVRYLRNRALMLRNSRLQRAHNDAVYLLDGLACLWDIKHINRESNVYADSLARLALDSMSSETFLHSLSPFQWLSVQSVGILICQFTVKNKPIGVTIELYLKVNGQMFPVCLSESDSPSNPWLQSDAIYLELNIATTNQIEFITSVGYPSTSIDRKICSYSYPFRYGEPADRDAALSCLSHAYPLHESSDDDPAEGFHISSYGMLINGAADDKDGNIIHALAERGKGTASIKDPVQEDDVCVSGKATE